MAPASHGVPLTSDERHGGELREAKALTDCLPSALEPSWPATLNCLITSGKKSAVAAVLDAPRYLSGLTDDTLMVLWLAWPWNAGGRLNNYSTNSNPLTIEWE